MRISSGALALFFGLGLALPASAQTTPFQMLGSWLDQRGITVQIPALPIEGLPANTIVQQTTGTTNGRQITIPTGAFARVAVPGGTNTVPVADPIFAQLASNFQLDGPVAVTEGTQIPPGSIVAGVPAKVIKQRDCTRENRMNAWAYHRNAEAYRRGDHRSWDGPEWKRWSAAKQAEIAEDRDL